MYWTDFIKKIVSKTRRFITFGLIGIFVFFQDLTLTWLFVEKFHFKIYLGVSLSYVLAILVHFFLNNFFTFKQNNGKIFTALVKYLLTVIINYVLTIIVVTLSIKHLSDSILLAKAIAIISTFFTSYFLMNAFVFKRPKNATDR